MPKVKFITKIYHCNISDNGTICLNLLKKWNPEKWNPKITMDEILKSIYQMLADKTQMIHIIIEVNYIKIIEVNLIKMLENIEINIRDLINYKKNNY